MVDVVREPDRDAALRRADESVSDGVADGTGEPEVVERDVERLLRAVEEADDGASDFVGRLAAVGERADLDQVFARCEALYARLAAW